MSAYLRTWWQDSRLAFEESSAGGCFDNPIILQSDQVSKLWEPNLYIDNLVDATWMKDLTYVYSDGRVWRSEQVLLTTKCKFKFVKMPFDDHICSVKLASYSLGVNDLRLISRGGAVGAEGQGVGLEGRDITSVMWKMEDSPNFTVSGVVDTSGGWDYLVLQYRLTRMPKFYITQYMVPDLMFLMLVYMGFFVNPNAAPARAAVAVIPVLILRTLGNSVYSSIPQISKTNVWLCDYLLISMVLCCLCTIQFGIVQYSLLLEKPGVDRAATLKAKKDIVKKCLQEAKNLGVSVAALLKPEDRGAAEKAQADKLAAEEEQRKKEEAAKAPKDGKNAADTPPEPDPEAAEDTGGGWSWCGHGGLLESSFGPQHVEVVTHGGKPDGQPPPAAAGQQATSSNLTEADLTLVVYACNLFHSYAGSEGFIGPRRMSKVLQRFNLFYQPSKCMKFMTLFLHDRGMHESDEDLKFHVDLFLDFLVSVNDYLLAVPPPRHRNPWCKDLPPSVQWDVLFRILFPSLLFFKMILFFAILPVYPENISILPGAGI